jgi:hypothetical protein
MDANHGPRPSGDFTIVELGSHFLDFNRLNGDKSYFLHSDLRPHPQFRQL